MKFRHLQEVSHFAVHGVLARRGRLNTLFAEAAVHIPLGFVPVPVRRRRHVREHHPNATVAGADPNLADLHAAGLRPGATVARYVLALIHPLTPSGVYGTVRGLAVLWREPGAGRLRIAGPVAVTAASAAFGWEAALFVLALPRLLLYPQLAWMSLLVEHRWFDPETVTGPPVAVEAGRCLRLYPRNTLLALLARGTWLPYGDLYHFAHSAHPAVRWNYLPALERSRVAPPTGRTPCYWASPRCSAVTAAPWHRPPTPSPGPRSRPASAVIHGALDKRTRRCAQPSDAYGTNTPKRLGRRRGGGP
ncbi:fatty acid desaturase [Streptomyces sp. INA 01156]